MFRKTYYSKHDLDSTLANDLHWIKKNMAEFELGVFQTEAEGVKEKVEELAKACGFELIITESDEIITGDQIILFAGHKKTETVC